MTEVPAPGVSIRVLGGVECGEEPARLGGPKQRLLLALLVARTGQVVSAGAILDALWGDQPPDDAKHTLQVFVSRLRTALRPTGGTVRWRDSGYVLEVSPGAVDLVAFEQRLAEASDDTCTDGQRHDLLTEALALWRGHPFGDLGDHPVLAPDVERLTGLHLAATVTRADLDLAAGGHARLVPQLRRIMVEHPLAESAAARLMLALHRSGRRGEALTLFDHLRRTLVEELGVDPSHTLQQLHLLLLDDDPRLGELRLDRLETDGLDGSTGRTHPRPGTVAVLPLHLIGHLDGLAVLASGLHTDLITELSKIDHLTTIGRTSVLDYPPTGDVPRIARELGVAAVVEGSLQGLEGRYRLTVGLIDGTSGTRDWTVTYEDELTVESLFSVQRDLAREIASRLSSQLLPGLDREPVPTTSLDAYRLVAAGRLDYDTKTEASLAASADAFRKAAEIDPRYLGAWVGLCTTLVATELYGYGDRHVSLPLAESAVHRALAIDPESPEALTALGSLHVAHQDGDQALTVLHRAGELRPSHDTHAWLSWVQLITGQADAALENARAAVEFEPRAAEAQAHLALALAVHGAPDDGVAAAREARRLSPYATAALYEATCLLEAGRADEALPALAPLVSGPQEPDIAWTDLGPQMALLVALTATGQTEEARSLLDTVDPHHHPFALGLGLLALGEPEAAVEALGRVETLSQWPAIVLHHFHQHLWDRIDPSVRPRLVEVARRSWRMP